MTVELEAAMEGNRRVLKGDQQRHAWEQRAEEERLRREKLAGAGTGAGTGAGVGTRASYDGTGVGVGAGAGAGFRSQQGQGLGGYGDLRSRFAAAGDTPTQHALVTLPLNMP